VKLFRSGDRQLLISRRLRLSRSGAFQSDEGTVPCPAQEPGLDQGREQRIANVALETPEAPCLGSGQPKSWHLYKLALDAPEHVIDAHEEPPLQHCRNTG
jgi:hypothetical protein